MTACESPKLIDASPTQGAEHGELVGGPFDGKLIDCEPTNAVTLVRSEVCTDIIHSYAKRPRNTARGFVRFEYVGFFADGDARVH